MILKLLQVARKFSVPMRSRATYYQPQKRFPPAFIRRFMLRYPRAHLYFVLLLCSSAMIGPVLHSVYMYLTLSKEEFNTYRVEKTALVRERQKYGTNLWIPFYSSGKPQESSEETQPIA